MRQIEGHSDRRNKAWCIHCGAVLSNSSRDHVPTKSLLAEPHPLHLPQVRVCRPCNSGFSVDEEYLVAFLGSVMCGSADPARQTHPPAARVLANSAGLRKLVERSRREFLTVDGRQQVDWRPDETRINRIVVKNARGHVMHELGEPMLRPPTSVMAMPLVSMTATERAAFEDVSPPAIWPEVGSRMMERIIAGDLDQGWLIVQEGYYRYALDYADPVIVRSVVHEYLATEVIWDRE